MFGWLLKNPSEWTWFNFRENTKNNL